MTLPPFPADPAGVLTAVVADDFEAARALFKYALERTGRIAVVGEAGDGRGALEAVTRHHPDLAVLDLAMPLVGGLDVIEDINSASPFTRVVVVSAFPGRALEDLVAAKGAGGYVRKQPSIRAVVDQIIVAAGALELAGDVIEARRRFGPELAAPRHARRFVTELLQRWDCEPAVANLEVLISEVVTNAVVHARSAPEVAVRLLGDVLRVEVSDDSDVVPAQPALELTGTSGRGMGILDAEASRWGVSPRRGGGKTVWFEVLLDWR